jgi:hypothetical protein
VKARQGELVTVIPCDQFSGEPDPRDLLRPFPADLMRMWPISMRVNKPENDDASIVEPVELSSDVTSASE